MKYVPLITSEVQSEAVGLYENVKQTELTDIKSAFMFGDSRQTHTGFIPKLTPTCTLLTYLIC